jgi:hypothetical protein
MAHFARIDRGCIKLALLALGAIGASRAHVTCADAKAVIRSPATPTSSRRADAETLLTEMALAAGTSKVDVDIALDRYRADVAELHATGQVAGNALQKAQFLHGFLHRRVLLGTYQVPASNVTAALSGGPFNCTSATAIFLALATEFGLQADAMAAPGHVWCRVTDDGAVFDVETTQTCWTAHAATSRARSRPGRSLNDLGLAALVHYNQGVHLHRQARFIEAIEANRQALELDHGCHQARENLLAATHNWSLMLAASGQGVEALPALASGLATAPHNPTLWADVDRWLRQTLGSAEFSRR